MTDHFVHPGDLTPLDYINNYLLDNGNESIWSRESPFVSSTVTVNQALRCNGFRCKRTGVVNSVVIFSGGTAAGATPTLVKVGAYHKEADGSYTLVGSSVNTTSLFSVTNNTYVVNFTAPWYKIKGEDYLIGILIVTAAALPTIQGPFTTSLNVSNSYYFPDPLKIGSLLGQSDLPNTIAAGTLVGTSPGTFHAMLRPV